MKRVFFGKIITLFLSLLSISQLSYAMEEKSFVNATETENIGSVVERMRDVFNQKLENKFLSTPRNFYEAIVRLKSIEKLLERSVISTEILGENFKIDATHCTVLLKHNLPHDMLHPIFNYWFQNACNKILLEHPKSIEAMNFIINRLSANVTHQNKAKYRTAIKKLPMACTKYIKNIFIDAHGWPYDIKPFINFDEDGISTFKFLHNDFIYEGKGDKFVTSIRASDHESEPTPGSYISGNTMLALKNELNRRNHYDENPDVGLLPISFDDKEEDDVVFPAMWEVPSLEEALEKRAQENGIVQSKSNSIIS